MLTPVEWKITKEERVTQLRRVLIFAAPIFIAVLCFVFFDIQVDSTFSHIDLIGLSYALFGMVLFLCAVYLFAGLFMRCAYAYHLDDTNLTVILPKYKQYLWSDFSDFCYYNKPDAQNVYDASLRESLNTGINEIDNHIEGGIYYLRLKSIPFLYKAVIVIVHTSNECNADVYSALKMKLVELPLSRLPQLGLIKYR